MPIKKYRSIEEMESPVWYEPGDPALFRALRHLWGWTHRLLRPHFPPGVYRFRTLEERQALLEKWDQANFDAYIARRDREIEELERREQGED